MAYESARKLNNVALVRRRKNTLAGRGCWAANCFENIEVGEKYDAVHMHDHLVESFHLECFTVVFQVNDFDAPNFVAKD